MLRHQWKYFQYLTGFSLPLKTNLEMVRIFKRLKETVNTEVTLFQKDRLGPESSKLKSPLALWKSSLSALLPRRTVDAMFMSEKVRDLLNYLRDTYCADETLWTTITGNKDVLPIPGAFNASAIYDKIMEESHTSNESGAVVLTPEEPFPLREYYISRYQVWPPSKNCAGKYVRGSCVFGIGDIDTLLSRPEMVAHKFYLDIEPAAYFCVYKSVRQRAVDYENQERFQGTLYSKLPQVRMAEGEPLEQVQFFFAN
ncbi:core-2/I-Branching enzyme domain-containing protein [Ditylenchus destructor]|nr:core-2/I-Branching enzyme domain-containing protein [Ditylenchus destructor]